MVLETSLISIIPLNETRGQTRQRERTKNGAVKSPLVLLPASVVSRGYSSSSRISPYKTFVKTCSTVELATWGGGGGICTRDRALEYPILAFQASAFGYSATPPSFLAVSQHCFEDVGIMPVVEPEYEFIQVCLGVFGGYSMVDADDCPLEQAPEFIGTEGLTLHSFVSQCLSG